MNTRDIEAFLAVVETGSIVAASNRLNLTQPGVTRRVQNLEALLGSVLLDRNSKPLRPTAAGRRAYEHGLQVLRGMAELRSSVSGSGELTGEFRLGIVPYLSDAALSAPLDRLRAAFPGLALQLSTDWSPKLAEQLTGSLLDAAALCLPDGMEPPQGLVAERLATHPVLVVASESLRLPEEVTLRDLARHPFVLNQTGCGFRKAMKGLFDAANLPFRVAVEAADAGLRLSLIRRGMGVGVVTAAALAGREDAAGLRVLDVPGFRPVVHAWLLHRPPLGRLEPALATFAAALREALRDGGITA